MQRIIALTAHRSSDDLDLDRDPRDALLWNWRDPVRLRNRIVHGYWSVDLDVLVATARDDLPALLDRVRGVAATLDELDAERT